MSDAIEPPFDSVEMIHGYRPTDVRCPYCGACHGMRERLADGSVRYRCWCGAKRNEGMPDA